MYLLLSGSIGESKVAIRPFVGRRFLCFKIGLIGCSPNAYEPHESEAIQNRTPDSNERLEYLLIVKRRIYTDRLLQKERVALGVCLTNASFLFKRQE